MEIESADVVSKIFGSYDINARMIEKAFSVHVANDVQGIAVSGTDGEAVDGAAQALRSLCEMSSYSEVLTEQTTVKWETDGHTNIVLPKGSYLVVFDPVTESITVT